MCNKTSLEGEEKRLNFVKQKLASKIMRQVIICQIQFLAKGDHARTEKDHLRKAYITYEYESSYFLVIYAFMDRFCRFAEARLYFLASCTIARISFTVFIVLKLLNV